jgi:F5/8 type C domain-containing protein
MSAPARLSTAGLLLALTLVRPDARSLGQGGLTPVAGDLLDASAWQALPAEGVELHIAAERDPQGQPALRLDYDFHGRGGWAAARRRFEVDLPEDYELRFLLRGVGPPNHLEVKLIDPSGENVWWHVKRDLAWPAAWTPVRIKKRQIEFAWGPRGGGELRRMGFLEITVTAGDIGRGGRGTVWIGGLALVPRAPALADVGPPRAEASSSAAGHPAALAVDGDRATAWRAAGPPAELTIDLGAPREFGGLTFFWDEGRAPHRFRVDLSEDGETWTPARTVERGGAPRSDLLLTESEARFVRLRLEEPDGSAGFGLAELTVRPLAFGASPNAFFEELAREAPSGAYPPGFSGLQSYWTVVGSDGDPEEALFSEYGILETGERGFSLEPFVFLDGRLWSWANLAAEEAEAVAGQSLADGDLPIPTVTWPLSGARLEITALATDPDNRSSRDRTPGRSALFARYRLRNLDRERLRGRLFVAVRPFQVNPPQQFLNVAGGVSPLSRLACEGDLLRVDGASRVAIYPAPTACGATAFDEGLIYSLLAAGRVPDAPAVEDGFGYATAALAWDFDLSRGKALEVEPGAQGNL